MIALASVSFIRVSKRFGATQALNKITMSIGAGEIACIMGPNGSGKSTLLGLAAGLGSPSTGEVRVGGVGRNRSLGGVPECRVGYLPQESILYEHLTGLEHLRFMAQLSGASARGVGRLEEALEEFGLGGHLHRRTSLYSAGMRRKVALLSAMSHAPHVILLDEPLAGLDTPGIERAISLIRDAEARGACVLVSTHRPDAFSGVASRWLTLRHGRLVVDRATPMRSHSGNEGEATPTEPRCTGALG